MNLPAHAAPVPWPPDSVIEPASSPFIGWMSNSRASLTPTTFCSARPPATTTKKSSSSLPPRASERASADRPTVVKNAMLSGVISAGSNSRPTPAPRSAVTTAANSIPPTTASGML